MMRGGRRLVGHGMAGALLLVMLMGSTAAWARPGVLHVRRISPSGNEVPLTQEVVIVFDHAMVPLGHMGRKTSELPVRISPDPGCQWRWLNTSELACRLPKQHRFAPATRFTIRVGRSLKALDGSHLARSVVRSFSTQRPQVVHASLQKWISPVMPVFEVDLNFAVKTSTLAQHLEFVDAHGRTVEVKVEPSNMGGEWPRFVPVKGRSGAVTVIDYSAMATMLDAHALTKTGRRTWLVEPIKPLVTATHYDLRVRPGMHTTRGPLAGSQNKAVAHMATYGPFAFLGITCTSSQHRYVHVKVGDTSSSRCRPDSVSLRFSDVIPRDTLASIRWQPRPMSREKLAKWVQAYPSWRLDDNDSYRDERPADLPLQFELKPMTTYTLTVPAGVKGRFGRTLATTKSVTFRTGHRTPFVKWPPRQVVLESGQSTVAPLRFLNLSRLSLDWQQLSADKLLHNPVKLVAHKTNLLAQPGLTSRMDQVVTGKVGVRQLLHDDSGVLRGRFHWHGDKLRTRKNEHPFFAQVTPYEVLVKVGYYGTLVWVSRLDNGQPVAGAMVQLLHRTGKRAAAFKRVGEAVSTGPMGMAWLPETDFAHVVGQTWLVRRPKGYFVAVTKGISRWRLPSWLSRLQGLIPQDGYNMALLPLKVSFLRPLWHVTGNRVASSVRPIHGHMRAWAVTGQGIYQPGHDVSFALFARDQGKTRLQAPPELDYTLSVIDPKGNIIWQRKHVKLSAYGEVHAHVHMPAAAAMGWYHIQLAWPMADGAASRTAGRFLVTNFVPTSFKVHAQVQGSRLGPGDRMSMRARATLHAGGPYTDAHVRFVARLVPESFAPDTMVSSGFTFGGVVPGAISSRTVMAKLDRQGQAKAVTVLPNDTNVIYGEVRVEAAVQSARGKWIADTASVRFSAVDRFVGLDTHAWVHKAGEPISVDYLVVDPAGHPETGSPVTLMLQGFDMPVAHHRQTASGWVTVGRCDVMSVATPQHCRFTPARAGRYRVVARVTDTRGRVQQSVMAAWVTGADNIRWPQHDDGLHLVPDKAHYRVGETAHILVQNPYPGARALLTVERFGVLWKRVVTLHGSAPIIDVPIRAEDSPGAFLSVMVFSPRTAAPGNPDKGRPKLKIGYMRLKVQGTGDLLKVAVTPAKAQYQPGQQVAVDVKVRTHAGEEPGKTRLVVAVADQGVLDLLKKGVGYFDPGKVFHAPPDGPDMLNFSLAKQLLGLLPLKPGSAFPPPQVHSVPPIPPPPPPMMMKPPMKVARRLPPHTGGWVSGSVAFGGNPRAADTMPHLRRLFQHAVYWNAALETDASGHAHFNFKLPDNLTRWRILVIAMRPGAEMGLGDGSVRTSLPIQVKPTLPNQVHVGDHFVAAFTVTNRTGASRDISTQIRAHGAIVQHTAASGAQLSLASFAHGLSWLPLTAGKPGTISLVGTARSGPLGDAVKVSIPVTHAGSEMVAAEYGSTTGMGTTVSVKVPAKAVAGAARVAVTLAPTLVGGLDGAFRAMRDDALPTWEARLSRAVLASDYQRLKPVLGNTVIWPDAAQAIQQALVSAADFQAADGGMAFLVPQRGYASPYLSVYTALAFDWLRDAGHAPPVAVEKKLHRYLRTDVLGGDGSVVLRAGSLAALAMAPHGKLAKGAIAGMLPKLHEMRLFGQALLLDAAIASQDRKSADAIAGSLLNHAEESAGELSFNEPETGGKLDLLATPLRSNCAILDALSRYHTAWGDENLVGSTAQKLMRWVVEQRGVNGSWPNSQENVFCTTAITHYADAYEKPVKALVGTLALPGQKPQSATFASRAAAAVKLAGPATKPGQKFDVKLSRGGKGRLYYGVQVHYIMPPDFLPAADAGMTVSRHYFVQSGTKWLPVTKATELKRGDIVRVGLVVDAPTERHHVILTDPLPGAFEAVNRHLAGAPVLSPALQSGWTVLMFDDGPWLNLSIIGGGFYHREMSFDAVRFFAGNLPAGHYRLVYAAQVIASGSFVAPAPSIKEIYQPDVFGRGLPAHIKVAMPKH